MHPNAFQDRSLKADEAQAEASARIEAKVDRLGEALAPIIEQIQAMTAARSTNPRPSKRSAEP